MNTSSSWIAKQPIALALSPCQRNIIHMELRRPPILVVPRKSRCTAPPRPMAGKRLRLISGRLISVLIAAWLLLCASESLALEFQLRKISDGGLLGPGRASDCRAFTQDQDCLEIIADGEIRVGDNERFMRFVDALETSYERLFGNPARVGKVFIDSPGGSLLEAMAIGRTIRSRMISAQVSFDSVCYSACAIVFMGAVDRFPAGPVGVHAFYSKEFIGAADFQEFSDKYNQVAKLLEEYVREMRVSLSFLDISNRTPYELLHILDVHELFDLGLAGIDPVYFQLLRGLSEQSISD